MRYLSVKQILKVLRKHLSVLVCIPLALAVLVAASVFLFGPSITVYTSTASFYIDMVQSEEISVTPKEIAADYHELISSRSLLEEVAAELRMKDMADYSVSISLINSTHVMKLSCKGPNANTAYAIAHILTTKLEAMGERIDGVEELELIDAAKQPDEGQEIRLNATKYALVAGVASFAFIAVALIGIEMFNTKLKTSEDIEEVLDLWVMAQVPRIGKEGK